MVDTPGGGGKRLASTFGYYDPETGVSVYSAPAVKSGRWFFYFDPLYALGSAMAERWRDPEWQRRICARALDAAQAARAELPLMCSA